MKMFKKGNAVDTEIDRIIEQMNSLDPKSKEYETLCARLEDLYSLKPEKGGWKIWIPLLGTFVGGLFSTYQVRHITKRDEEEIVSTKAFPFIKKS